MLSLPLGLKHQLLFESLFIAAPDASFLTGEILFAEGDCADYAIYLVSGQVSIYVASPSGEAVEVARRGPGELIGEMALATGIRCASARALEPAKAIRVSYGVMTQLVNARPDFALALYSLAIERLYGAMRAAADRPIVATAFAVN